MTIQVTSVLLDPMGNPVKNAVIRYTAISTELGMLSGIDGEFVTDKNGFYDFPLEYGRYRIEILYSDEYHESGTVLVDEHTPTPITLQELVLYTTPYNPPIIDPEETNWAVLLQEVVQNDEWNREAEVQVRDGNVLVNDDKTIHKDGDAYLAKEIQTVTTGSIEANTQSLAYEDNNTRSTVNQTRTTKNHDITTHESVETFIDQGQETVVVRKEISGSEGSITDRTEIDEGVVTKSEGLARDTDAHTKTIQLSADEVTVEESALSSLGSAIKRTFLQAAQSVEQYLVSFGSNTASDTTTVTSAKSARTIEVDELNIGTALTVNTEENSVTVRGKLNIENSDDFKGEQGNTYYYEYAYATDEEKEQGIWQIDDPDNPYDVEFGKVTWRKHRHVSIVDGDTYYSEWTEPYLLTGADGQEGDTIYWVYRYSPTNTIDDRTVDAPEGWDLTLSDGDLYRIERLMNAGEWDGTWSLPAKIAGADGDDGELVFEEYLYGSDATAQTNPPEVGKWNSNFNAGDFYRISRVVKYAAGTPIPVPEGTEPTQVTEWSDPVKIVPEKGIDYFDGIQGNHGSGSYTILIGSIGDIPDNAGKDLHLASLASRDAQAGDILTYTDGYDGSGTFTKQYLRDTSVWAEFALRVDGSAIINGTLAAESLKSGSAVTDVLYISNTASKAQLTLSGSGAWVDSNGVTHASEYTMWSGAADPASAPMRLSKSGVLTVSGANVEGHITAYSLMFVDEEAIPDSINNENAKEYTDANFVSNVVHQEDIGAIQSQLDNSVTSWFGDDTPTPNNHPANQWVTTEEKDIHVGDLYYDNDDEISYRWLVDQGVYLWVRVVDPEVEAALAAASKAQDTADGKRRVFFDTPVAPYDRGDLWDTGNGLKRCDVASTTVYTASDWIWATDANGAASEAEVAAKAHADAQANLAQVTAEAYADGVATDAELAAIAEAQTLADQAEANAKAASDPAGSASAAQQAAEAHAEAEAELARITAEAYADGIVSDEEARAIADAQAKADAAEEAAIHASRIGVNLFPSKYNKATPADEPLMNWGNTNPIGTGFYYGNDAGGITSERSYGSVHMVAGDIWVTAYYGMENNISLQQGRKYVVSAYVLVTGATEAIYFTLYGHDYDVYIRESVSEFPRNVWTRIFIITDAITYDTADVSLQIMGKTVLDESMFFADIQIERLEDGQTAPTQFNTGDNNDQALEDAEKAREDWSDENVYPDQDKIQISSQGFDPVTDNYGWGISSSGKAYLYGGIETKGANIEGGVIFGARIVEEESYLAVDADGQAGAEYYTGYEGDLNYVVYCTETVSANGGTKIVNDNYKTVNMDLPLVPAWDRHLPITDARARVTDIPANVFKYSFSSFFGSGDSHTFYFKFQLLARDMKTVVYTSVGYTHTVPNKNNASTNKTMTPFTSLGMDIQFYFTNYAGTAEGHASTLVQRAGTYGFAGMEGVGGLRVVYGTSGDDFGTGTTISGSVSIDNSEVTL